MNYDNDYLLNLLNNDEYSNFYESVKDKKNCKFCNKQLFKYCLNRHYKTCKFNPNNIKANFDKNNINEIKFNEKYNNNKNLNSNNIIEKHKNIDYITDNMEQNKKYICLRCKLNCKNNKAHLRKHLLRKTPCIISNLNYDIDYLLKLLNNDEYIEFYENIKDKRNCKFCNKQLFKYCLNRHYKTCKLNPENI